ncbi:hypothetical protein NBRC116588_26450 [Pyruvatibacter sp. HU-CL02332]
MFGQNGQIGLMEQILTALTLMAEMGDYIPEHVAPWLTWMQIVLIALPFVFIYYRAARMMILAQLVNFLIATVVFMAEGNQVTRLFGLGHVAWVYPMILYYKDIHSEYWKPYRVYAAIAAATIAISLVMDVRDVALWVGGDRESTLVGLPEGYPAR